jgi:hypothetical protein
LALRKLGILFRHSVFLLATIVIDVAWYKKLIAVALVGSAPVAPLGWLSEPCTMKRLSSKSTKAAYRSPVNGMRKSQGSGLAKDDKLVQLFIASFESLDGLFFYEGSEPLPEELSVGMDDEGYQHWRPAALATDRDALTPIYQRLSGSFPALYERLVLSYRWIEVHLETVMLLANPPGPTLGGLAGQIFRDPVLVNTLVPAGFIPFGKIGGGGYDPMCFDLNSMKGNDCPIIQFEHEAILCHDRIGESWARFSSFRNLMCDTIEMAQSKGA